MGVFSNLTDWISHPALDAYIIVTVLGLCVGSFLNVVIYRLPQEGLSIVKPRSFCPRCQKQIIWKDNIPVFSYLVLGGKCRNCKVPISLRYPAVEAFTGFAFAVTLYLSAGQSWELFGVRLMVVSSLIAITMIDWDHWIIPDSISIPGMILAPILSYLVPSLHQGSFLEGGLHSREIPTPETALIASLLGILAGAGGVYLVGVGGKLLFRKDAMGFGDVKLMGAAGGLLGAESVVAAFFVGAFVGAVFGLGNVLRVAVAKFFRLRRRGYGIGKSLSAGLALGRRAGSYIPFGPFLAVGILVLMLFRAEFFQLALEKWPEWIRSWLPS